MALAADELPVSPTLCRAHSKRTGEPCNNKPMHGQVVCRMHGGSTSAAREAAKRRLALRQVGMSLGVPREIDPATALLEAVYLAAGDVEFLRSQLPDDVVVTVVVPDLDRQLGEDAPAGATRRVVVGDGVDVRVKLYYNSLDRMARLSKLALDAGIAERVVRLKESEAATIVTLMVGLIDDPALGLSPQQRAIGRQRARTLLLAKSAQGTTRHGVTAQGTTRHGVTAAPVAAALEGSATVLFDRGVAQSKDNAP